MAIALDQNLGHNAGGSLTSISVSTAFAAAANSKIIVVATFGGGGGTVSFSGGSLTWTVDKQFTAPDGTIIAIGTADAAAGLASATSLTATSTVAGNPTSICASSWTGLAAQGSVQDGTGSTREQFNATSWAANGLTTLNANDLVFCVAQTGGAGVPTNTPSAGWTKLHDFAVGGANEVSTVYQIVAATGTYTPSGTWSTSQTGADQHEVVFAYKAGSGAPSYTENLSALIAPGIGTAPGGGAIVLCANALSETYRAGGSLGPSVQGKTAGTASPIMQKSAAGWTYVSQKTAGTATPIDQKGAPGFTKVKGH